MKAKPTTIKDIAKQLEIHHSTVSRALNDHPDISSKTRKLVVDTAKDLDYKRNPAALVLRGDLPATLGVVVPDLRDRAISSATAELGERSTASGLMTLMLQSRDDVAGALAKLVAQPIAAGFIFVDHEIQESDSLTETLDTGTKLISIGNTLPGFQGAQFICTRRRRAELATLHLINSGFRRIALLSDRSVTDGMTTGYKNVLLDNFAPFLAKLTVYDVNDEARAMQATQALMASPDKPDAIVCARAAAAVGAAKALAQIGVDVPGRVGIISLEETETCAAFAPALSAVATPWREMMAAAFDLLADTDSINSTVIETYDPVLQPRESTRR
ncbi:hypothetical protein BVY04_02730 [bacterium M21]|nr:hypothetical protein BVY04_02730 [bacterium M21]